MSDLDQYATERAIVAKVQAEMRAEDETGGRALLRTLDSMDGDARVRFMAHTVALEREQAAALDYAESRLSEMRAHMETLANRYENAAADFAGIGGDAMAQYLTATVADLREVARG